MNYKFIFSFFCLWFSSAFSSQAPAIEWQRTYGGTSADTHMDVQQTSDGGYIHIGASISNNGDVTGNHGNVDIWVVKTNASGDILWQKSLGGTSYDQGSSIRQTSDGGYILAGTSNSNNGDVTGNNGNKDYWVVKLNATGNIQWQKNYGGNNDDIATSIRPTSEGGYIVTGYKSMAPPTMVGGDRKYWVVKLDSSGNIQWQNTYGGENWEEAYSIEQTTDGGYIVAGYSSSLYTYVIGNHGAEDYWIIKINAAGALEWQKSLGGTSSEKARAIKQAQDGGYFVVGHSFSNNGDVTGNNGDKDYWVVKLSATGNIIWQKSLGTSLWEEAVGVDSTLDGGCVVTGYAHTPKDGSPNNIDYWVLKLNSSGNIEWQNYYGGLLTDQASSIQKTSDGGYILGGFSYSGPTGSTDYWIIKLAGNQLSTHENNSKNNISIYPNPAKDFVTISHLPNETTISILDLSGRKIFNKKYAEAKVSMNISQLTNGTYIIQVDDQEKTILSEKLIIKK
ncbi:T9SS type A sorting domain-containing protein [Chryseobacterium camelliae]|uniref:T9SS type A sorting domain-containing protein n=1 Tax=Chryseobacterium camelliae TaxID=1265445 RepID=A0ABY7QSY1_9FLAO|nr:T9SS type A sorting domain-containing protein [Chryseobacterium camelliae]WBV61943.1 T9SS type A sorting domain-containing protein [Chryseobacterium camelliae]